MVFKSIAIIGSGNVATNIAHALGLQENIQLGIYSPTMQHRYDLSIATKSILYNNLDETFSADGVEIIFKGVSTHPGFAYGKLENSIKMAGLFLELLSNCSKV